MCADIFPTGWHATELAGMKPGDAVVIYGCRSGRPDGGALGDDQGGLQGDGGRPPSDRLKLAESIGAIAIDYSKEDPVQRSWS